jgi:hypothetical protein
VTRLKSRAARLALGPAAALVVTMTVAPTTADGQPQAAPARVIDRTMLCSTLPIGGGLYQFEVRAQEGIRQSRTTWRSLAFAAARSGHVTIGPAQLENSLAWAGAGRVSSETSLDHETRDPYLAKTHGTLALNQKLCSRSSARVRLTARGLDGGPPGQFGQEYDCPAPRRVLVRLRATVRTGEPIYRDRHFVKTRAALQSAYLAIRTRSGKPLAFAAVFESGKARLLTATSCLAD